METPHLELSKQVKKAIVDNDLDKALNILELTFLSDQALLLRSSLNDYRQKEIEDTHNPKELNRIKKRIIKLANQLAKGEEQPAFIFWEWIKKQAVALSIGIAALAGVLGNLDGIVDLCKKYTTKEVRRDCSAVLPYQIGIGDFEKGSKEQGFSNYLTDELDESTFIRYQNSASIIPVHVHVPVMSRSEVPPEQDSIIQQAQSLCIDTGLLVYGNILINELAKNLKCRIQIINMSPPSIPIVPKGIEVEVLKDYVFYAKKGKEVKLDMDVESSILAKFIIGLIGFYSGDSALAHKLLFEVIAEAQTDPGQRDLLHEAYQYVFMQDLADGNGEKAEDDLKNIPKEELENADMQMNIAYLYTLKNDPDEVRRRLQKVLAMEKKMKKGFLEEETEMNIRKLTIANAYTLKEKGIDPKFYLENAAVAIQDKEIEKIVGSNATYTINEDNKLEEIASAEETQEELTQDSLGSLPNSDSGGSDTVKVNQDEGSSPAVGDGQTQTETMPEIKDDKASDAETPKTTPTSYQKLSSTDLPDFPKMIRIPGGNFMMGSENGESDEKPVHEVTVSTFYLAQTEVTVGQYNTFCTATGKKLKSGDKSYPVTYVSWHDAVAYCEWLSQETGDTYRLPTEAEWEFAARGGNTGKGSNYTYAGGNDVDQVGWYSSNSGSGTHPVGQKRSNALGLYDMSGNVWEWCQDWYGSYSSGSQTDPTGPTRGDRRVYRGGGWYGYALYLRVADRSWKIPDDGYSRLGLRPARTL